MRILIVSLLAVMASCSQIPVYAQHPLLPDPTVTPGVQNPLVTQENLKETICNPKANFGPEKNETWVKAQRPPTTYTNKLKAEQMKTLGLTGALRQWEEDHFWPIEAGGNPRDPNNLWPQWWPVARQKDVIENEVHKKLCSGEMKLSEALDAIKNWPALYEDKTGKKAGEGK